MNKNKGLPLISITLRPALTVPLKATIGKKAGTGMTYADVVGIRHYHFRILR